MYMKQIEKRRGSKKKYIHNPILRSEYQKIQKVFSKYLKHKKRNDIADSYNQGRLRDFYEELRRERKGFKAKNTAIKDKQSNEIRDKEDFLTWWREYFSELLNYDEP